MRLAYTGRPYNGIVEVCSIGYRLRGHRDQITSIRFLSTNKDQQTTSSVGYGFLLTSSKDTLVKLWDLSNQHCIQTVVAHRSEVWTLDVNPTGDLLFTGSGEGELKAWRIDYDAMVEGVKETVTAEVSTFFFLPGIYFDSLELVDAENYYTNFDPSFGS